MPDFLRTVIPAHVGIGVGRGPADLLRAFFRRQPTPTARHLAEKAVIGLAPEDIWEIVIWPEGQS